MTQSGDLYDRLACVAEQEYPDFVHLKNALVAEASEYVDEVFISTIGDGYTDILGQIDVVGASRRASLLLELINLNAAFIAARNAALEAAEEAAVLICSYDHSGDCEPDEIRPQIQMNEVETADALFETAQQEAGEVAAEFERRARDGDFHDLCPMCEEEEYCFPAGTQIQMADGSTKPIEEIQIGDEVLSFDPEVENGLGALTPNKVTQLSRNTASSLLRLNNLTVTLEHGILTSEGEFKNASDLKLGDTIYIKDGSAERITNREIIEGKVQVYNFAVQGNHTYIANSYRVHNASKYSEFHFNSDDIIGGHTLDDNSVVLWGKNKYGRNILVRAFKSSNAGVEQYFATRYLFDDEVTLVTKGEISVTRDADGDFVGMNYVAEPTSDDISIFFHDDHYLSEDIGRVLGSALGKHLFGDGSFVTTILSGTAFGVLASNVAGAVERFLDFQGAGFQETAVPGAQVFGEAIEDSFEDIASEFVDELRNQAIGAVSSYLTAELIDALGLDGFGGQLASTVGNTVINNVLTNIVDGNPLFSNVNGALPGAVGSFLGSKLANEIISADTVAGQLGGSIGGSIGALVAGKLLGKTLGNFLAPGIGALIGTLLGTLIGDLFGKTPRSGADLNYNPHTGQFSVGAAYKKGKGSKETAQALAGQVGETLNGVLGLVGGTIINPEEIDAGHYGMRKSKYTYKSERADKSIKFTEAGDLIAFGALGAANDNGRINECLPQLAA